MLTVDVEECKNLAVRETERERRYSVYGVRKMGVMYENSLSDGLECVLQSVEDERFTPFP